MSVRGNENIVGRASESGQSIACPKCGSSRTNVTVRIDDEGDRLTLYSCGTCDHRFSRAYR